MIILLSDASEKSFILLLYSFETYVYILYHLIQHCINDECFTLILHPFIQFDLHSICSATNSTEDHTKNAQILLAPNSTISSTFTLNISILSVIRYYETGERIPALRSQVALLAIRNCRDQNSNMDNVC